MLSVQRMEVQLFIAREAQKRFTGRAGIELGFEDLDLQKQGKRSCRRKKQSTGAGD